MLFSPVQKSAVTGGVPVILRGTTGGHFQPLSPVASGLAWRGDVRAAAVLDGTTLVMTVNDAPPKVATASGSGPAMPHRVQLDPRGPVPAETRVTTSLPDGRKWLSEIPGGGSYWSQSGSTVIVPAAATELTVRWPDGTTSQHALPANGSLRQP
ncbi:MAG: ASPIC/UnbV domain-containing protein [Verrucomicrobiales bacterium]